MSQPLSTLIRQMLPSELAIVIVEEMDGTRSVKICFDQEQPAEGTKAIESILREALKQHGYNISVAEETYGTGTQTVLIATKNVSPTQKSN